MTTVATATIALKFDDKGIDSSVKSSGSKISSGLSSAVSSGSQKATKTISAWTIAAGNLISDGFKKVGSIISSSIDSAMSRSDTMANYSLSLQNLGYSADDASSSIEHISDRLSNLPTTLDGMASAVKSLSPSFGTLDEATDVALALNDALLAGGESADAQAGAMTQLTKMFSAGSVTAGDWTSVQTAMPGQLTQVAKAMLGESASADDLKEALKSGKISMDDFGKALVKLDQEGGDGITSFAEQAENATGGIETSLANAKSGVTKGVTAILDQFRGFTGEYDENGNQIIDSSKNIFGQVTTLGRQFGNIMKGTFDADAFTEALNNIISTIGEVVPNILDTVIPGIEGALQSIGMALIENGDTIANFMAKAIEAAITVLCSIVSNLIGPLIITLVNAIPSIIEGLVNAIVQSLPQLVEGVAQLILALALALPAIIQTLADAIPTVIETVVEALLQPSVILALLEAAVAIAVALVQALVTSLPVLLQSLWAALVGIFNAWDVGGFFQNMWNVIVGIFSVAVDFFKNMWNTIVLVFEVVIGTIVGFFQNMWNTIVTIFSVVGNFFKTIVVGAWNGVKAALNGVKNFFKGIWNGIKSIFSGVVNFFKNVFKNAWNGIKNVFSNVGKFFGGIWNTIKEKFGDIGQKIGDTVGGAFKSAINAALTVAENIINTPIRAINGLIDIINNIPGISLGKLSEFSLPRLAQGGYASTATSAVFGEAGAEVALPLEKNTDNWAGVLSNILLDEIDERGENLGNGTTVYMTNEINNDMDAADIGRKLMTSIRRAS